MFRDKQSSIRKEISRLLEIKGKTIAFVKALVFFYSMIKHYLSLVSTVTLFICLGMGSLIALPMDNRVGISGPEIFEIEIENDNRFEHAESNEGVSVRIYGAMSDDLLTSKSRSTNLVFQDRLLAPVSPPPKHA